ncbi:hypothetical protein AVE92_001705 [Salmonella enterica subsp. enterica]|nr:hypothetical protein [Salmonella enterica subsp. enterica serovar Typhimurium var. 5-]EED8160682.1 hypothetical protein [Salmonella enterica subsp. enterica]EFH2780849.1 hypothetical protein [Escherichia coli]
MATYGGQFTLTHAGVCLCHTCYYSKEGGFVPMEPCKCGGFRMEDHCSNCDPEEE